MLQRHSSHLIENCDPEEYDEVLGVICSPSHISFTDKTNLVSILRGLVNGIMVVSEPFAVAFGLDQIAGSIVVDIGAGTTDIARIYGTFPTDEDQVTIEEAGDWLDHRLMDLINKKYAGAQLTQSMFRRWKEKCHVSSAVEAVTSGRREHNGLSQPMRGAEDSISRTCAAAARVPAPTAQTGT